MRIWLVTLLLQTLSYLLPLPPTRRRRGRRGEKKLLSRVTTPHQRDFRIPYVINSDLCERGHHAAHHAAGRRVLSRPPPSINYLCPVGSWQLASVLATCTIIVICHVLIRRRRPTTSWCSVRLTCCPSNCLLSFAAGLYNHLLRHQWLQNHISTAW